MTFDTENNSLLSSKKNNVYGSLPSIENGSKEPKKNSLWEEISILTNSSIPLIITFFLQYSLTAVSIFSVGHIGKNELAAVSLATMTFNVTISIVNGMATCLDTFCSQAYGAKKYNLVGLYFQRCTAMIMVCSIPIILLWYYSYSILSLVVPNKDLALLAQTYLRIISFGAPGYIFFETGKRFLQAQNIFVAGQYCLFICAPINAALNYFLVWDKTYGIGFAGAPISTAISYWLMSILLLGYVLFIDGSKCWYGLQLKDSFKQWMPMMKLALNGTAMLLSEFIAFEILTLSASRFGTSQLAAQSVVSAIATITFQIPFGVAVASSTRIASFIGAGRHLEAIFSTKITAIISVLMGITNFLLIFSFRYQIASSYTNDEKIIQIAAHILSILAFNQIFDCPNVLFAGCLRGQGRQAIGSSLNLIAYYIIAVPVALALAFRFNMGLTGLWIGLGIGILFLAVGEGYFLLKSNWKRIIAAAEERNEM